LATPITMPRLGLSMVEGTVTEWKVDIGATVERGQPLLLVESEKAEVEIEAFASGAIAAIYVPVGETVPIGALLGALTEPGEAFDAEKFAAEFVPETEGAPATAQSSPPPVGGRIRTHVVRSDASRPDRMGGAPGEPARAAKSPGEGEAAAASAAGEPKAAPAARALAKKLGVDLASVQGSGPGGRILPADVERAVAGAPSRSSLEGEIVGAGPAVVLVSGFGVDRSGWRRQVDGLQSRFRVAAFDHRGVGGSPPLRRGATIADLADDLAANLRAHGLERTTLVGASLGAAVVLEVALREPSLAARIVCLSPVVLPDTRFAAILRSWADTEDPEDERRIRSMLPWLLGRKLLESTGKRAATAAALRAMAAQTPAATLAAHAEALLAWLGTRVGELERIRLPALVLIGEDDCLTPLDQARAVASRIPGARLEIVLGAGHALMVEQPDAVNAAIAAFAAE
jgi:pimeloyl-ACP methyl ester carboxylesterase